ncbi:hypothetical protein Tco_0798475 [Tanacetum coccineum]
MKVYSTIDRLSEMVSANLPKHHNSSTFDLRADGALLLIFSAYVMLKSDDDNLTQEILCIEDMVFPTSMESSKDQKKLSNPEKDVIFDLNVALWMFTRRVVILKRVEDLQLGVESYQKKLNLTKPETFRSDISKMTPYTAYKNPQGIIYLDKYKRNRLMRSDKLYKFCDRTLTSVINVLHDIANDQRMEYLPK